jgi:hypothetical protein
MTLDELIAKVPEKFRPVAVEFGPALIKMGQAEVMAWIILLAKGKTDEAYKQILANLPNADILAEWSALNESWTTANAAESANRDVVRRAGAMVLQVLVTIAATAVGL